VKRSTTANSTYPKGGVSCSADTFVKAESSVLRMKFSGKSPALRVAANRCMQVYGHNLLKAECLINILILSRAYLIDRQMGRKNGFGHIKGINI